MTGARPPVPSTRTAFVASPLSHAPPCPGPQVPPGWTPGAQGPLLFLPLTLAGREWGLRPRSRSLSPWRSEGGCRDRACRRGLCSSPPGLAAAPGQASWGPAVRAAGSGTHGQREREGPGLASPCDTIPARPRRRPARRGPERPAHGVLAFRNARPGVGDGRRHGPEDAAPLAEALERYLPYLEALSQATAPDAPDGPPAQVTLIARRVAGRVCVSAAGLLPPHTRGVSPTSALLGGSPGPGPVGSSATGRAREEERPLGLRRSHSYEFAPRSGRPPALDAEPLSVVAA